MPPINFRPLTADDVDPKKDPTLSYLNSVLQEHATNINILQGVHGPIPLLNHVDLQGNRILNVGAPKSASDALSQTSADPMYSSTAQQKNMEAVGAKMLQTTRRLNDSTQRHRISSDLNSQGSIPPTITGQTTYTSTATTITVSWPATIQYADLSIIAISSTPLLVTGLGAGSYFMYPYYDTRLGIGSLVTDSVNGIGNPPVLFPSSFSGNPTGQAILANAAQSQNSDGRVPLSNGSVAVTVVGGGSGGGGGSGCIRAGMMVQSKDRGTIPIESTRVGEVIRAKSGWTSITRKAMGSDRAFVRLVVSNGEALQVTPSHPLALFDGSQKPAGELCLGDLLAQVDEGVVPAQIMELAIVQQPGHTVLLSCEPDHEYLVGNVRPRIVAHNTIPLK